MVGKSVFLSLETSDKYHLVVFGFAFSLVSCNEPSFNRYFQPLSSSKLSRGSNIVAVQNSKNLTGRHVSDQKHCKRCKCFPFHVLL